MKKVWQAAAKNKKYKEFKKALGKASDEDDDSSSSNDEEQQSDLPEQRTHQPEQSSGLIEQRTKKRKILKSFQEYTNSNEDEGKFKGWSLRAGEELSRLTEKLSKVTSKEKLFRRAYRHTFKQKLVASGKKKSQTKSLSRPTINQKSGALKSLKKLKFKLQ